MDVFSRLAPFIQDFIYENKWEELRGIQVAACEVIFDSDDNLLLSSGTASGKTEAAFLPVLTELYRKLFDNFTELGRLHEARDCADYVMSRWPDSEEGYLMRIRLAVEDRNGAEIQQILGKLKENKIYLSAEARKIVEFWKEDHEEQQ